VNRAEETRFRGEPAVRLVAGELAATFVPGLGMTGVSLRCRGREHLALPGGLDALRRGGTTGLPLLAPWANRLGARRYRAAGVTVDLRGLRLHTDDNGLPIHGLLVGRPGWRVERVATRRGHPELVASIDIDAPAFPFPHRLTVAAQAHEQRLVVDTTLRATGRRRVPVAFGWHPYLRVPGTPRRAWRLRLPARTHLLLDDHGLPTGVTTREDREDSRIGAQTFDDLYALGRDRRLAYVGDDGAFVELHAGTGFDHAQVWIPSGRPFGALEPMTSTTNALVDGSTPLVEPGDAYTARFALTVG
jgi:galactose mutarotase-like enzyme